jgi:hypothetical protein
MTRLVPLALACLLAACGVPDVTDLRLDGLSPPHIARITPYFYSPGPDDFRPAIVVELSTARNLRILAIDHASSAGPYVVTCRGRTHIPDRERNVDVVVRSRLQDTLGVVDDSLQPRAAWPQPIDGRYRYTVAIALRQQGREERSEGRVTFSRAELDLMRDPVDLCLWIDTSNFGPRWRSNTVVIPAAAIRTAIDAAQPPR